MTAPRARAYWDRSGPGDSAWWPTRCGPSGCGIRAIVERRACYVLAGGREADLRTTLRICEGSWGGGTATPAGTTLRTHWGGTV